MVNMRTYSCANVNTPRVRNVGPWCTWPRTAESTTMVGVHQPRCGDLSRRATLHVAAHIGTMSSRLACMNRPMEVCSVGPRCTWPPTPGTSAAVGLPTGRCMATILQTWFCRPEAEPVSTQGRAHAMCPYRFVRAHGRSMERIPGSANALGPRCTWPPTPGTSAVVGLPTGHCMATILQTWPCRPGAEPVSTQGRAHAMCPYRIARAHGRTIERIPASTNAVGPRCTWPPTPETSAAVD